MVRVRAKPRRAHSRVACTRIRLRVSTFWRERRAVVEFKLIESILNTSCPERCQALVPISIFEKRKHFSGTQETRHRRCSVAAAIPGETALTRAKQIGKGRRFQKCVNTFSFLVCRCAWPAPLRQRRHRSRLLVCGPWAFRTSGWRTRPALGSDRHVRHERTEPGRLPEWLQPRRGSRDTAGADGVRWPPRDGPVDDRRADRFRRCGWISRQPRAVFAVSSPGWRVTVPRRRLVTKSTQ